ncbi:MAG: hypothetical protein NTW86_08605 [Candidatus Sumerlaeota bacterium]|nr:hypothetical protein [Candidatus Sumerlaeota bacterium]
MSAAILLNRGTSAAAQERRPLDALIAPTGCVAIQDMDATVIEIEPAIATDDGKPLGFAGALSMARGGRRGAMVEIANGQSVVLDSTVTPKADGMAVSYVLTPSAPMRVKSVHVSLRAPLDQWGRDPVAVGAARFEAPKGLGDWNAPFDARTAESITLGPSPQLYDLTATVALKGSRAIILKSGWGGGQHLDLRLSEKSAESAWDWAPSNPVRFEFTVSFNRDIVARDDGPVTMQAGPDWIPLQGALEVEPGSALDFSALCGPRVAAGELGWLRASKTNPADFEFERQPGKGVRFYGVNMCSEALFLSHEEADRIAERWMRRGYTCFRITFHERGLLGPNPRDSVTLAPEPLDQFDYLFAAMKRRGIYMTTDLYIGRFGEKGGGISAAELIEGADPKLKLGDKSIFFVSPRALDNLKEFNRRLLTHVNPYTGLAYMDDPALAWISLINEPGLTQQLPKMRKNPAEAALWNAAWAQWQKEHGIDEAWDTGPNFHRFLWETQGKTEQELTRFLRDELHYKGLITDLNGFAGEWGSQALRQAFDYVDGHFYWEQSNSLNPGGKGMPSRGGTGGGSMIRNGGAANKGFGRLFDKPFTVTEFNYYGPNPYRAQTGLLVGAFAGLQDWAGLWSYTYGYNRDYVLEDKPGNYGDLIARDPLHQAFEYAIQALFVRGDVSPAAHALAFGGEAKEYWERAGEKLCDDVGSKWLGWCLRLGTFVGTPRPDPTRLDLPLAESLDPKLRDTIVDRLKKEGFLPKDNATDPAAGIFESDTGQIKIESRDGIMTVATPRTVGLAGPAETSRALGPLTVSLNGAWATLWVSSLDDKPIAESDRLLLVHLTDLKNTGERFRGQDMKVHEEWGAGPRLAHAGSAAVNLKHSDAKGLRVWRLDLTGKRVTPVSVSVRDGALEFEVSNDTEHGATLYYEIAGGQE